MGHNLLKRIHRLEVATAHTEAGKTVFIMEDGSQFFTEDDPLTYLLRNGPQAPTGRLIEYEYKGDQEMDALSRSLYEYMNELFS